MSGGRLVKLAHVTQLRAWARCRFFQELDPSHLEVSQTEGCHFRVPRCKDYRIGGALFGGSAISPVPRLFRKSLDLDWVLQGRRHGSSCLGARKFLAGLSFTFFL